MKLLFLGDIVGRAGRDVVLERLPSLQRDLGIDFTVVNVENAAGGFGITQKLTQELLGAGIDCLTTGNHVWDQKETVGFIGSEPRLLRPMNFPAGTPGRGHGIFQTRRGKKVLVANIMGRLFMDPLDDPFAAVDQMLNTYRLGGGVDVALIDFHAEATSEKMAFAHHVDGRASAVVGTHTHIPTADHMILAKGTAYQTDAGMCGDYDSVIGMDKVVPIQRFTRKLPTERLTPASGPGTLCGIFIETEDATGLARRIEPVRIGGKLAASVPKAELVPAR